MTTRTSRPISGSAVAGPAKADIHSCGYFCDRPACIKAQRDMLPALHHTLAQTQLDLTAQTAECFALRAELKELDALKADIANALTDLTDCSIENDALRARVAELESADTCGRVCEGTAYRLEARSLRARVAELESGYVPVGWQWLDTGHFRKSIPNDSDACDWNRIYRRS